MTMRKAVMVIPPEDRKGGQGTRQLRCGAFGDLSRRNLNANYLLGRTLKAMTLELLNALGGEDEVTPQQRILVDRVVYKICRCNLFESAHLNGDTSGNCDKHYLSWANSLRNDLLTLGLERRMKKVMDLRTYLDAEGEEKGDEA